MTDYSNWKILKTDINNHLEEYGNVAEWCNNGGEYHIEEQDIYYVVVKNPEPSEEELKDIVRNIRNKYLQEYDFTQLTDAPFTDEEKSVYAQYRQYLRDYTDTAEWWLNNPMDFNSWRKNNDISW